VAAVTTPREVARLERELAELILEWERFFSGDRRTPPAIERDRLRRRIRDAAEARGVRGALAFRLEQLQHRFATYAALWERLLREREEGRRAGIVRRVETPVAGRPAPPPPANASGTAAVPGGEADLYERWRRAKERLGDRVALGRDEFEARLEAERVRLREQLGGEVEFDVIVRDGKVRLAARRGRRAGGGGRCDGG